MQLAVSLPQPKSVNTQDFVKQFPHDFPRRLLLAVTGLSPQVVTESLYALALNRQPVFVPTEIRLLTTNEGAERARLSLLHPRSGWFHKLRADYALPAIKFDSTLIHVLQDADGKPLADIRSANDNVGAADAITAIVRELTGDANAALHVSIAGGRKTMGFYLGYALSLYGRPQDRLSHVLVNEPFESHPHFFYPTRESRLIHTPPPNQRPFDTRDATVTLAEIPFVRLREGLPKRLLRGGARFSEAVAAAQRAIGPLELVLDLSGRGLCAGGETLVDAPPALLAFMAWLARRQTADRGWLPCPSEGAPEAGYAREYMAEYRQIVGPMGETERTANRLRGGMDEKFFSQTKSKLHGFLRRKLGERNARPYLVVCAGKRPARRYGIDIDPSRIRFEPLAGQTATTNMGRGN